MCVDLSKYTNRHSFSSKLKRLAWDSVYPILFRSMPRSRAMGWKRLLLRIFGAKIGKGVRIESNATFWAPWNVTIGDNSWIGGGARLYAVDKITIGANVVISQDADICTASHDITSPVFELITKPITIGDGAWAACHAAVLPGVTVGEGAVLGYAAVATKDVEPWSVVAGNPATVIKKRELKGE